MDKLKIAGIGLLIIGLCVITIGIIFSAKKSIDTIVVQEPKETRHNRPRKPEQVTELAILPTSLETVRIPRSSFQRCTEDDFHHMSKQWSVTVESRTESVGTPSKEVIEDWKLAKNSQGQNDKFALYGNGHFVIMEEGFFAINTQVTFSFTGRKEYSVNIMEDSVTGHNVSIKGHTLIQQGSGYLIRSTICGNVTNKLRFFIKVPKPNLIFLYPKMTFFSVTHWK